jgi:hypothetical protein
LANADKGRVKLFFERAVRSWPLASVPVDMPSVVVSIAKRVDGWEISVGGVAVGGERASSLCRDEYWRGTKSQWALTEANSKHAREQTLTIPRHLMA